VEYCRDRFWGPLLFVIFISNLVDICTNNIKLVLFADDAKMYCHIKDIEDKDKLQTGIDKFVNWTDKLQVKLNVDKCCYFLSLPKVTAIAVNT